GSVSFILPRGCAGRQGIRGKKCGIARLHSFMVSPTAFSPAAEIPSPPAGTASILGRSSPARPIHPTFLPVLKRDAFCWTNTPGEGFNVYRADADPPRHALRKEIAAITKKATTTLFALELLGALS